MTSDHDGAPLPGGAPRRISGAELRIFLDMFGLTPRSVAELLHVREDTVRKWIRGREPIPLRVGDELELIEAFTDGVVRAVVAALERNPIARIYRTDEQMWAVSPAARPYPASWWRMVVALASLEVPDIAVEYAADFFPPPLDAPHVGG